MSKRVGVMIPDEEIWQAFRKFVEQKWGRKYSVMGVELQKALKNYMRESEHAHTERKQDKARNKQHKDKSKPRGNSAQNNSAQVAYANGGERTKRRIIQHLEESGMMEAASLSENAVKKAIAKTAGHDKRTVEKYFCMLEEECLLPKNIEFE